jgi:predicted ABC-type ATPase
LKFSEAQIIEKIIAYKTAKAAPVASPKCVIFGGQPGSGKTELEKMALKSFSQNAVVCNADDLRDFYTEARALKKSNPDEYIDLTAAHIHRWNQALTKFCIQNRFHIILESTLSQGQWIEELYNRIRQYGYQLDVHVLAVPNKISKLGIYERFETMVKEEGSGRRVKQEGYDQRFESTPNALRYIEEKACFDTMKIFGREVMNPFSDKMNDLYLICEGKTGLLTAFLNERNKPFPKKALHFCQEIEKSIIGMMREREAPEEEIEKVCRHIAGEIK